MSTQAEKPIIGILGNTYKTQPGLFSSAAAHTGTPRRKSKTQKAGGVER